MSGALVSLNANEVMGAGTKKCALAIVLVTVKLEKGTKIVQTYAFLDGGSSALFCAEALMHQLNVDGKKQDILLKTWDKPSQFQADVYSHKSTPVAKENIPKMEDLKKWPYLKEVDLTPINASIGLLTGVNTPRAMELWKVISSQGSGPYAMKTSLGGVINGPFSDDGNDGSLQCNRISIEEMLVQQYNQDFTEQYYEDKNEMYVEDLEFMKVVSSSAVLENGHYNKAVASNEHIIF